MVAFGFPGSKWFQRLHLDFKGQIGLQWLRLGFIIVFQSLNSGFTGQNGTHRLYLDFKGQIGP